MNNRIVSSFLESFCSYVQSAVVCLAARDQKGLIHYIFPRRFYFGYIGLLAVRSAQRVYKCAIMQLIQYKELRVVTYICKVQIYSGRLRIYASLADDLSLQSPPPNPLAAFRGFGRKREKNEKARIVPNMDNVPIIRGYVNPRVQQFDGHVGS